MRDVQPCGYGAGVGNPGNAPGIGDPDDPDDDQAPPEYVQDRDGNPGISKIDEGNLRQIASDLGVDYHHRDGKGAISSVYKAPKYDQALVKKDGRVTVDEYYWVPLILVFAWIAVELVFGVREYLRLKAITPKRPRRGGPPGPGGTPGPGGPPGPGGRVPYQPVSHQGGPR